MGTKSRDSERQEGEGHSRQKKQAKAGGRPQLSSSGPWTRLSYGQGRGSGPGELGRPRRLDVHL